jgi:hypothetical protein
MENLASLIHNSNQLVGDLVSAKRGPDIQVPADILRLAVQLSDRLAIIRAEQSKHSMKVYSEQEISHLLTTNAGSKQDHTHILTQIRIRIVTPSFASFRAIRYHAYL